MPLQREKKSFKDISTQELCHIPSVFIYILCFISKYSVVCLTFLIRTLHFFLPCYVYLICYFTQACRQRNMLYYRIYLCVP